MGLQIIESGLTPAHWSVGARCGLASYWHRELPAAGMSFWATASGDHAVRRTSSERIISVRTVLAGSESVTCREYVPVYEHIRENPNLRIIHCNTTDARFSASFVGNDASVAKFYATLQSVKKMN